MFQLICSKPVPFKWWHSYCW